MKEFINRLKKIERTKKLVIIFITISFIFIFGITTFNALTDNFENNEIVATTEVSNKNDKKEDNKIKSKNNGSSDELENEENNNQNENNKQNKDNDTNVKENTTNKKNTSSHKEQTNNDSKNYNNQDNNSNQINSNNTTVVPKKEMITVKIQVIGMGNTMMSGDLTVEKDANAYSVLKELADNHRISLSGSKYYVSGIGNLKEKQHGPMSGWMYKVNGNPPNKAAYYYKLENNDSVVWYYVNYE